MYRQVTPESDWHPVGPTPPQYLVCPYQADLHTVIDTVAQTRTLVENSIVKAKHQGGPIKTTFLLALTDHVDVAHIDPSPPPKERRQELSQAGDGAVFTVLPLLTKEALKSCGMNVSSLPRANQDDAHFRITGVRTPKDQDLQTKIGQYFLLEDFQLTLMNQQLHDILHTTFDLSAIRLRKYPFHAVIAFQTIHVAMINRIIAEKGSIANDFTALGSARAITLPDIIHLTKRLNTFSIAFDALGFRSCFDDSLDPQVLTQILDSIQSSVSSLSHVIQTDVNQTLSVIRGLIDDRCPVDSNVLNNLLLPIYSKIPKNTASESLYYAAMSNKTTPASTPDPTESAFYSRPGPGTTQARPPPRQQPPPTQAQRPRQPESDRKVLTAPDRRRDSTREPFAQQNTRNSPRPGRADSPDPAAAEAEIKLLQSEISGKQSKLARMKAYHQQALIARPLPDDYEAPPDDDIDQTQQWALHSSIIPGRFQTTSSSSRSSRRSAESYSS